jgi:hypothetical protein
VRQVIYSLRFEGQISDGPTPDEKRANSDAPCLSVITVIDPDGVGATVGKLVNGGKAHFESRVKFLSKDSFEERGTIDFGNGHTLTFATVTPGHIRGTTQPGLQHGGVIWEVTGGTGQFQGATGLIMGNFFIEDEKKVIDHHLAYIFTAAPAPKS